MDSCSREWLSTLIQRNGSTCSGAMPSRGRKVRLAVDGHQISTVCPRPTRPRT